MQTRKRPAIRLIVERDGGLDQAMVIVWKFKSEFSAVLDLMRGGSRSANAFGRLA